MSLRQKKKYYNPHSLELVFLHKGRLSVNDSCLEALQASRKHSFGQTVFTDRVAESLFLFYLLWRARPPPPGYVGRGSASGILDSEWLLYLWLTRRGNNAANMHLSPPSYRHTSFSASSLLILCLRDLDSLFQESIFFPPCWQRRHQDSACGGMSGCGGGGGGEVALADCIVLSSGPGLAAAAVILLSTSSKQRQNEKAVCKLISSTAHYETHARTFSSGSGYCQSSVMKSMLC